VALSSIDRDVTGYQLVVGATVVIRLNNGAELVSLHLCVLAPADVYIGSAATPFLNDLDRQ